ncbi:MAG TPA: hypothetical protein VGL53_18320 [Bryobacteraceae bacterium]
MALLSTFRELGVRLRRLQDTFVALRLTVVEDKPVKGDSALVDRLEDTILDLMGLLHECMGEARKAQRAVENQLGLEDMRRALSACQEQFHGMQLQFGRDLGSYENLNDLANLGAERRGEWKPWSGSVRDGVEQCRQPLDDISTGLSDCWQEIAERAGSTSISVHTTGQQITVPTGAVAAPGDAV